MPVPSKKNWYLRFFYFDARVCSIRKEDKNSELYEVFASPAQLKIARKWLQNEPKKTSKNTFYDFGIVCPSRGPPKHENTGRILGKGRRQGRPLGS